MNKTLSSIDVDSLKSMALRGVTPADICRKLGCAISTVHYYKDKFRKEGLKFPSVKGKRPSVQYAKQRYTASSSKRVQEIEGIPAVDHEITSIGTRNSLNLVVNGVTVQIAAGVKSVQIQNNTIKIKF